ncbi:hypothetical protein IQ07DRAFT_116230 [Pyrenochaeta sp. DS3sAY3a]|nr:hypothetical protein IQ07DRAFT_116230 [Pyrenochaeta sp. DS3sAY3a]
MSSIPPFSPTGLPSSPRVTRPGNLLSPLDTSFQFPANQAQSPSPYSGLSEKQSPQSLVDTRHRNRDSLIFINATIPLSPASSTSSSTFKEQPYDGLVPRKRSGLARLLCCFGREERARRRMIRETEFEKVGEACHWTEY